MKILRTSPQRHRKLKAYAKRNGLHLQAAADRAVDALVDRPSVDVVNPPATLQGDDQHNPQPAK